MVNWEFCKKGAQTSPDARCGPCSADSCAVSTIAQHTPWQTRICSTHSCQQGGCSVLRIRRKSFPAPKQTLFSGLSPFSNNYIMELTLEMDHSLRVGNTWSSKVAKKYQLARKRRECAWKGGKGVAHRQRRRNRNVCISVSLHFQTVLISPWQTQELPCPPAKMNPVFYTSLLPLPPLHSGMASLFQWHFPCSADQFLSLSEWALCLGGN